MSIKYLVLDRAGNCLGKIIKPSLIQQLSNCSGFRWKGRNYFYMPFHSSPELGFVFQEVFDFLNLEDTDIEERDKL